MRQMDENDGQRNSEYQRQCNHHKILDIIPESAGPRLATFRGGAIHSVRPPGSQTLLAENHFAAVMLAPAPKMQAASASDKMCTFDAPIGMLAINPAHSDCRMVWSCTRENAVVALSPDYMLELALHEFDAATVELQLLPYGTIDLKALRLAELLKAELTQGETASDLYTDSLVTLFGIHLLRNYSDVSKPAAKAKGGLSSPSARRVEEFLNENFSRKLSVVELAAISGLSPYHFIRAFTKTFGQSPHQYLLSLRLAVAEKFLIKGDMTIADIAYHCGFSSQSHLTAAMRKHRHSTPAEIRPINKY